MKSYRVTLIPGDGVGPEVTAEAVACLATIAVLRRELGWRWTAAISAGTIVLALLVGGIVARLRVHRRSREPAGRPFRHRARQPRACAG